MGTRRVSASIVSLLIASGIACSDDATGPAAESGTLSAYLNVTGDRVDPDGFTIAVDDGPPQRVAPGSSVTFTDLAVGTHAVTVADVEAYCTVGGYNPRSVILSAGDAVTVQFDVICGNAAPDFDAAGMEILGSGYDVAGNYADVADVKAVVLDLGALQAANLLRQVQYERATYQVVSGENSQEYQRSLSARVKITGSGFGFSGALRASFNKDRYESRHYAFATVQSLIRKHGLRVVLPVTPEQLRGFLTPSAATAINDPSVNPLDLFEVFGTHVLTGIIVGGRLDFNTSANMSFEKQARSIDVYARASFKSIFASASIEAQATDDLSWSEYSATEEKHLEVYGGRSEYGQYIMNAGVYENWIESIEENPVFMDFESTGLLGIWELADDAARRSELASAWDTYAEAHGITLGAAGSIVSNFADDDEGWSYINHAGVGTPAQGTDFSYFGGYVVGFEDANYDGLAFSAPSEFLGDKTMYAGGTLEYYLWYCKASSLGCGGPMGSGYESVPYLVMLMSENGNLRYRPTNSDRVVDPAHVPNDSLPTAYAIKFQAGVQPGGGVEYQWYRWDGAPAEDSDIWMSLANLQTLRIWAEFTTVAGETVALDKVSLNAPPGSP